MDSYDFDILSIILYSLVPSASRIFSVHLSQARRRDSNSKIFQAIEASRFSWPRHLTWTIRNVANEVLRRYDVVMDRLERDRVARHALSLLTYLGRHKQDPAVIKCTLLSF